MRDKRKLLTLDDISARLRGARGGVDANRRSFDGRLVETAMIATNARTRVATTRRDGARDDDDDDTDARAIRNGREVRVRGVAGDGGVVRRQGAGDRREGENGDAVVPGFAGPGRGGGRTRVDQSRGSDFRR